MSERKDVCGLGGRPASGAHDNDALGGGSGQAVNCGDAQR